MNKKGSDKLMEC